MYKVIPLNCIHECIICYNKTINTNCCVQCNICILCNNCLKKEIVTCPACRKENFNKNILRKDKIKNCNKSIKKKINNYSFLFQCLIKFLIKCLFFITFICVCLGIGSFIRMMDGYFNFKIIDIVLNSLLGLCTIGGFMILFICLDMCIIKDIKEFIKYIFS